MFKICTEVKGLDEICRIKCCLCLAEFEMNKSYTSEGGCLKDHFKSRHVEKQLYQDEVKHDDKNDSDAWVGIDYRLLRDPNAKQDGDPVFDYMCMRAVASKNNHELKCVVCGEIVVNKNEKSWSYPCRDHMKKCHFEI